MNRFNFLLERIIAPILLVAVVVAVASHLSHLDDSAPAIAQPYEPSPAGIAARSIEPGTDR